MLLHARYSIPTLPFLATALVACGDDAKTNPDSAADSVADSAADTVADSVADSVADTTPDTATDIVDEDVPTHIDDLGFEIRVPQLRTVPSVDFGGTPGTVQMSDVDHVCKLVVDGFDGYVYVRGNPVSCPAFGGCDYDVSGAWVKVGTDLSPLAGVDYDFGGNHHNDWLVIPNGTRSLKLYHSSFGFGFRSCQPPDCAQIYDGATLVTDGCTKDRTLPVICVRIEDDGTEPPLEDTFAKCAGDPNLQ
ncbi:MAG: hypothetical protein U1F43_09930 [Myxococcota bacterium]